MNCYCHEDRVAANTCSHCGNWICGECTVNVNGRLLCKNCVAEMAAENTGGIPPYGMGPGPGIPVGYEVRGPGGPPRRRDVNGFFLFCLSGVPGLNYMYMGLMKKGLFFMTAFFLSIYLMSFSFSFMPFVTFIILCTSFFDGFSIRKRILAGEVVEDSIDDIVHFAQRNKSLLITFTCFFFALGLLNRLQRSAMSVMGRVFGYGLSWEVFDFITSLASLAIIGLGIFIIFRALSKRSSSSSGSPEDSTQNHNDYHSQD